MTRTIRNHGQDTGGFRRGNCEKTLAEVATQFGVHPTPITEWKPQLRTRATDVFGCATKATSDASDVKILHSTIGQRAREHDY